MIKAETIYKTTDGSVFNSLEEAEGWQYVLDIGAKLYASALTSHLINVYLGG